MGLTIHYSAKFNQQRDLRDMIEEVIEISQTHQWKYHIFEDRFPSNVTEPINSGTDELRYGLMVIIPHSEPLHLHFHASGNLGFKQAKTGYLSGAEKGDNETVLSHEPMVVVFGAFTKTQYAGVETHIKIVNLLKYIASKYLIDVEVYDEGDFWESNDEEQLRTHFKSYRDAMDTLHAVLNENCKEPNESSEEYLKRRLKEKKS